MRVSWNLVWVYWALSLPAVLGALAAWPFWARRVSDEIGSIVGAAVILAFALTFIAREYGEVEAVTRRCIELQIGCRFRPLPFVRYATFGAISAGQIFALFLTGLWFEERARRHEASRAS